MKSINLIRKNQILFGLLVITLAMSKSWLTTVEAGAAEFASTCDDIKIVEKGKEYDVVCTFQDVQKTVRGDSRIENGRIVELEPEQTTVTQATIQIVGCDSCNVTRVLPQSGTLREFVTATGREILQEREKAEEERRVKERRLERCEIIQVGSSEIEITRKNRKEHLRDILDCKYANATKEDGELTYDDFRRNMSGLLREMLTSSDEDVRGDAFDYLEELMDDVDSGKLRYYLGNIRNGAKAFQTIERYGQLAARSQNPFQYYQMIDYIVGRWNPELALMQYGPEHPLVHSMSEWQETLLAQSCGIIGERVRSYVGCNPDIDATFGHMINGRPVIGDGIGSPVYTHQMDYTGRGQRRGGNGQPITIPQTTPINSAVGNYNWDNRYNLNALGAQQPGYRQVPMGRSAYQPMPPSNPNYRPGITTPPYQQPQRPYMTHQPMPQQQQGRFM